MPITRYTVTGVPGGSCTIDVVPPATEPATTCTITGLTNGTPYKFTVKATSAIGDSDPSPESVEAIPSADLKFANAAPVIALPAGTRGTSYEQTLAVIGGLPPYSFSVTGSLPDGLSLDATTGKITGTPTTPGSYSFTVTVSDRTTQSTQQAKAMPIHVAQQDFTLQISSEVAISSTPVPTLSGWGVLLLSALTIGVSGFFSRRRS
ncbi:hypothetical protein GCM10027082_30980 [Comamonas humi]